MNLTIANIPNRAGFLEGPSGITTWKDLETGQLYLYMLTHPRSEDAVEVFEVDKNLLLTHVRSISDPSFTYTDDIVAVGKDQFYITCIWRYRARPQFTVESYVRWPNGRIVYYDGHRGREVAAKYFMANGINMSPDKSIVYMAECGYKTLHAFKREKNNDLKHMWAFKIGSVIDNIDVDPKTGDLWIGGHPVLWKLFDFYGLFGVTLPSQVIRVKIRDNTVSEVEEIYADGGKEIAGSTVATFVNGKLVIGSLSDSTVVCDVNYLSP